MAEILGPQRLGPLTPLVGEWEGNVGLDVSYRYQDDAITKTSYFERAWFHPIPTQTNGQQKLEGLKFGFTAWRHGEEAMDPFHDEVGYLLWDAVREQVMRVVVFGRGISMIAGGSARPRASSFKLVATAGDPHYGILQNSYLSEHAELKSFTNTFSFNKDGSFTYNQTLVLKMAALGGKEMDHTDTNTFHKVDDI